jgi:AmiR/NasT family two-component response regulator
VLDAGCGGYVTKPIKKAKLFETIEKHAKRVKVEKA